MTNLGQKRLGAEGGNSCPKLQVGWSQIINIEKFAISVCVLESKYVLLHLE